MESDCLMNPAMPIEARPEDQSAKCRPAEFELPILLLGILMSAGITD